MNIYIKMVCGNGRNCGTFRLVRKNRLMWQYIGFFSEYINPDEYHTIGTLVVSVKEEEERRICQEERRIGQSDYLEFREGDLDGYSS